MSTRINSLILSNRLLSQARSRTRSQSASLGGMMNGSSESGKSAMLDAIKNKNTANGFSKADAKSRENYTAIKKAAQSLQERTKKLLQWQEKEWEKMTEEELAQYKEEAASQAAGLVSEYNTMIKGMTDESGQVNKIYLSQLMSCFKNAKGTLEELGITQKEDGSLALDKEKFMAADADKIQKALCTKDSFVNDLNKKAANILANAETNLAVLNKSLYAGSYTYNQFGSDIFDMLTSGSKYSNKS